MAARTETNAFPGVVFLALAAYIFLDGVFLYLSALQFAMYALLAAVAAGVALLALMRLELRRKELALLLAWLTLASAWLLPPLTADYQYIRYVISDFVALVMPLVLLIVGLRFPGLFTSRSNLAILAILMLAAAILAVPLSESAGRHEPPHTLLIALAWAVFYLSKKNSFRLAAAIVLTVLALLAWTSGERTAVLLLVALGIAGRLLLMRQFSHALFFTVLITGMMLIPLYLFGEELVLALASTRLEQIAQGELDTSLLNRVLEVRDVWDQWSLQQWFGLGHGATYAPELSYPPRNLTEHGRVHHIHFGPALLLYRYGVIGLLLYIVLVIDVTRFVMATNRGALATRSGFLVFFFGMALLGYLASFLVFTIIPDPAFSYTLAGYLYLRLTQPVPVMVEYRAGPQEATKFVSPA